MFDFIKKVFLPKAKTGLSGTVTAGTGRVSGYYWDRLRAVKTLQEADALVEELLRHGYSGDILKATEKRRTDLRNI